jgi:hypothetical protein
MHFMRFTMEKLTEKRIGNDGKQYMNNYLSVECIIGGEKHKRCLSAGIRDFTGSLMATSISV